MNQKPDFSSYRFFTFDCYGTLIDWEEGILAGLRPLLQKYNVNWSDEQVLEAYAGIEALLESPTVPYQTYRQILRQTVPLLGKKIGFTPTSTEENCLVDSFANWRPFPDTVAALQQLQQHAHLVILSNIDDDLFALSARHLPVSFHRVITAQQVQSYKPSLNHFYRAIEQLGNQPERILHIAQSLYHDIVPARSLGLDTVWINRRHNKPGFGATPPATVQPNWAFFTLADLAASRV